MKKVFNLYKSKIFWLFILDIVLLLGFFVVLDIFLLAPVGEPDTFDKVMNIILIVAYALAVISLIMIIIFSFFTHITVNESGIIENFPGVVDGDWKNELEFPLGKKTQFRFWIYAYKDGKASVEWTLQPDGRYFEDEDGFGGENCEEITLWSYIDTNGFFTEPFKHR